MNAADPQLLSRQLGRDPLVMALAISLLVHVGLYGGWQLGKQLGWWNHHPTWLTHLTRTLAKATAREKKSPPKPQETVLPLTFVEVDPDTVTAEAPPDAKFYSSKNSKAANPDPKNEPIPKVDGQQEKMVRLMDNEKPKPFPLQPSPKPPEPDPPNEAKPKAEAPGDLALVRPRDPKPPSENPENATGEQKERPRRLSQVRDSRAMLSGQKMRQAGGVNSHGARVSFDAKATPFGDYDAAFIAAVENCWHLLLDQHNGTHRSGKVVVDFRLSYDGRITDMKVQENDTGEILGMLCQSAILNPAPYPRWPAQMRQTISSNSREMRFTFWYN